MGQAGTDERWPELPLEAWEGTKETLHRFAQIVGKIRLSMAPYRNHWWHVTLYVTARGMGTRPMPVGDGRSFSLGFDFVDHRLVISTSRGEQESFSLEDISVAGFHRQLFSELAELGIRPRIFDTPFDLEPATPFPKDNVHATYDREYVERWWQILVHVEQVLTEFSGGFLGKTSPVHLFWHTFDLAVTRFSGRRAPDRPDADRVTREAYSHEVVSFGFWAGDEQLRSPAFYSYTWPEPPGLNAHQLRPTSASWDDARGSTMAMLMYDDVRRRSSPVEALTEFLTSAYDAGATAAGWDVEGLRADPAT